MADWEVALEKQAATWAFLNSLNGIDFIEGFRQSEIESDPKNKDVNKHLHSNLVKTLWAADPVYVTSEMMDLLEAAWPKWESEVFREEDVFIPYGFVYLARPVVIKDVRGLGVAHRAIAWQPAIRDEDSKPATYVSTWSNMDDLEDEYMQHETPEHVAKLRAFFGQAMALNYATPMLYGMTPAQMLTEGFEARAAAYDQGTTPLPQRATPSGIPFEIPDAGGPDEIYHATGQLLQFLQCLWRLLGQRVAVGFSERPPRAQRRRLKDKFEEKYVTVIKLRRPRRPAGEDDEHHPVDWSHRWYVEGHWRWQPYKDGTVKQIWISPYIKGPEDKPLVIRGARVFRWAR